MGKPRKKNTTSKYDSSEEFHSSAKKSFHLEFRNAAQQFAYAAYQQHDVLFLMGVAGTGKTFLATAFAINDIINRVRKKIILTRPVVESGESLGFLPGNFEEKIEPYMMPIYDCIDRLVPEGSPHRERVINSIEVAPIAYMRGRNFYDAVCIFDEAQNATKSQLKLFLTRFNENCKIIVSGDPKQSDLFAGETDLTQVVNALEPLKGVGVIKFKSDAIVRHPLVSAILDKLEE